MSTQLIAVLHRHRVQIPECVLDITSIPEGSHGMCVPMR